MKDFLVKLKERIYKPLPITSLIPIYIGKIILLPNIFVDASILFALVLYMLGIKLLDVINDGKNKYFEAKDKVISENEFRANVNKDMSNILTELSGLKMKVGNPFEMVNRKK